MAVSITQFPGDYSFSDNPITYVFSSTQTAQANFSFIVKTYYNDSIVSEDRVFPESGTSGHIDISPIIKNLLNKPVINNSIYSEAGISGNVKINVTENYGNPPVNQATLTSTNIPIIKGCLSDRSFIDYQTSPSEYIVTTFGANFMTPLHDLQTSFKVYKERNAPFILQGIQGNVAADLTIELCDSVGVIDTFTDTQTYKIAQINITDSLLETDCGFDPLDIQAAEYVVVTLENAIFTVYLYDQDCSDYPSTLQWINEFGSWDSFIFAHNLIKSGDVTERTYTKKFGQWDSSDYIYDLNDSGNIRVGTQQIDKMTIYTDWITEDQQHFLTTLYKSPRHFLYLGTDVFNVKLNSNQFTFAQQRYEEEVTEAVELQIVNNNNGISL